jgi:hypothetical protein
MTLCTYYDRKQRPKSDTAICGFTHDRHFTVIYDRNMIIVQAGKTKGGSIIVLLTSCFTGLD